MSAKTTAGAGFWDVGGTWTGGAVPVSGDTVTLNHAVTVRDARTVGHSPGVDDAVAAILCQALLTITGAGVLTCRGDITMDAAGVTMQTGAILEFDASAAGTPSTAIYRLRTAQFSAGNGILTVQGVKANRAIIRSSIGGAKAWIGYRETGNFLVDGCSFIRMGGDGGHPAIQAPPSLNETFRCNDCLFDVNCGMIGDRFGVGANSVSNISCDNTTHLNGGFAVTADVFVSGIRSIKNSCLGFSYLWPPGGYDIENTLFEGGFDCTTGRWNRFKGNLIEIPETSGGDYPSTGVHINTSVLRSGNPTNPHGLTTSDETEGFDGCTFDMPDGTDGAGDMITFNAPSSPRTIYVRNCLCPHTESGANVGTLFSCLGGPGLSVVSEHNTMYGSFGQYLGETYTGHANMLARSKGNLAYGLTPGSCLLIRADPGTATDVIASGNATNNGKFNAGGAGNTGYDTNLVFSSGSPGAGDIVGDPLFVDWTRNMKKWDASLGGPGTTVHAINELRKRNDPSGYDPRYTIQNYQDYFRGGFVVQNKAMRVGAHDGTVMGAVQNGPSIIDQTTHPKYIISEQEQGVR